jgi:hypothetical protein
MGHISGGVAGVLQDYIVATQAFGIASRRCSEHAGIFAAELRSALVTDHIGCARGIGAGDEQTSCLLEAKHLLILKRAHRSRGFAWSGCTTTLLRRPFLSRTVR